MKHDMPPPNQYSPSYEQTAPKASSPGFGFGERSQLRDSKTPGPGNYRVASLVGQGPKLSMAPNYPDAKDPVRRSLFVPGPGQYAATSDIAQPSASKFSMGKEKRAASHLRNTVSSPSPDAYHPHEVKFHNSPQIGFGVEQRPGIANKSDSPGPGHYKIRSTLTSNVPKYLMPVQDEQFAAV